MPHRNTSVAVTCAFLACVSSLGGLSTAVADPPPQPGTLDLLARRPSIALARIGVTVEGLVAAGATPTQVGAVARLAASHLFQHRQDLTSAETSLAAAREALRNAESLRDQHARAEGGASSASSDDAACAQARSAVEAAEGALADAQSALLTAATAELDAASRARLDAVRANHKWSLPLKYLVKNRTDGEWSELRSALRTVNDASRGLATADLQEAQSVVATADADTDVSAANSRLQTDLAASKQAWNAAEAAAMAEYH